MTESSAMLTQTKSVFSQPVFWFAFASGVAMAALRYVVWNTWTSLIPTGLMLLGIVLGFVLMHTHELWLGWILGSLPGARQGDETAIGAIRTPMIFIVLPILGVVLLSSNSAALGLGAYWGVWSWYALAAWHILQGNPAVTAKFFPGVPAVTRDQLYLGVLTGFLLFGLGWGGAVAFL